MLTFVMLTRLSPDALRSPETLEQLEQAAMEHVQRDCPRVEWLHNFAILGPCDYLDIFRHNRGLDRNRVEGLQGDAAQAAKSRVMRSCRIPGTWDSGLELETRNPELKKGG